MQSLLGQHVGITLDVVQLDETKFYQQQLSNTMEASIDDMVVKSKYELDHL